jgi:hypothetical protein
MSDYFSEVAVAHAAGTTAGETFMAERHIIHTDESFVLLHVVHGNPHDAALTVGDLYVVFNTYAAPTLEAIHRGTRIPETRKDTVFDLPPTQAVEEGDPTVVAVAEPAPAAALEMSVTLPAAVSTDPVLLRTFLLPLLTQLPIRTLRFTTPLRLCKTAYHYEGSQKKRNDLIRTLQEIGGRVIPEFGSGPATETNMYLKCLSW